MDAQELKEHIIDNPEFIQDILEYLECHSIKEHRTEYRAGLPDDPNPSKVVVKKANLSFRAYTRTDTVTGDIFTGVGLIKGWMEGKDFSKCIKLVHVILGLPYEGYQKIEKKASGLDFFRNVSRKSRQSQYGLRNPIEDIEQFNESILDQFVKKPHIDFFRDNIMPWIQEEYGICYSPQHGRIIIPHYHPYDKSKIVGLVGRTTNPNYDVFDIPKYFNLISGYLKNQNLYGLSHNMEHIKKAGVVKVFESEKSVLQLATMGDRTGVAVGSHELTPIQRTMLSKLGVEVVICFDKDVSLEHIENTLGYFTGVTQCSYIYDTYGILGEKDSPTDKGYKIWSHLFKYRKQF